MAAKSPAFKLGVLNMTICFDQLRLSARSQDKPDLGSSKVHATLAPRYKEHPMKASMPIRRRQETLSPYLSYRESRKQSLRYFREHADEPKQSGIVGFRPQTNKAIQLQFKQLEQEESRMNRITKSIKDVYVRRVLNKKAYQLRQQAPQSKNHKHQSLSFNLDSNPQEPLNKLFTIRPAKTSTRTYRNSHQKQQRVPVKPPVTRQEKRKKVQGEVLERKLRPWSPTHCPFNRQAIVQSVLLQPSLQLHQ